MARRTDARRRICVFTRRSLLSLKIANRLKDKNDDGYIQFLLNRAARYRSLADSIAINELNEMPGNNMDNYRREQRLNNQIDRLVNSMSGCLQT